MVSLGKIEPSQLRPIEPEEYDRLVALGFFEGERVELVHRALVTMSPQGAPHIATINRLTELFVIGVAKRATVQIQGPLRLRYSRPEPDVAILSRGDHDDQLPSTALLVVEVAETSVVYDREVKADVYAEAEIPEYWLVNLPKREVEVYRDPRSGIYRQRTRYEQTESITPVSLPDFEVNIADFMR